MEHRLKGAQFVQTSDSDSKKSEVRQPAGKLPDLTMPIIALVVGFTAGGLFFMNHPTVAATLLSFHTWFYNSAERTWENSSWLGVPVREIDVTQRPQAIVELLKLTGGRRIGPAQGRAPCPVQERHADHEPVLRDPDSRRQFSAGREVPRRSGANRQTEAGDLELFRSGPRADAVHRELLQSRSRDRQESQAKLTPSTG